MTDQDKSDLLEWLHKTCKVFPNADEVVSVACALMCGPELMQFEWAIYQMYLKAETDEQREWVGGQYSRDDLEEVRLTQGQVMQTIRDEFESRFGVVVN